MNFFLKQNKHLLLLALIFILAEILVNPLGNFPINDDWSYAQSLKYLYKDEIIFLGNWPAMTLCTQILWGFAFTKIFGLSFFALRCSTLVATFIGLCFLNKLVLQISGNKTLALFSCLVLLFNPFVFNLSNSYMTDVNFNTLIILCCYYMYNFFRTRSGIDYGWFVIFSGLLVLLRQYGIIVPACFVVASFFVKERKVRAVTLSLICFALVFATLKLYEDYMRGALPPGSAYKFSGNIHIFSKEFWNTVDTSFKLRRREILIHLLAYPMPVAAVFLVRLFKQSRAWIISTTLLLAAVLVYCLFNSQGIRVPSTFLNMMLGNEVFHESVTMHHNEFPAFDTAMNVAKYISCLITVFVLLLGAANVYAKRQWRAAVLKPEVLFFVMLIFSYIFMILITETYFDRYHIPLFTMLIILLAYLGKGYAPRLAPALLPLLLWAYISVAGTKDYLEWHRQLLKAYWELRHDYKAPADKINAGGELSCWNEGYGWGWRDYFTLKNFNYLIQFDPEEDFVVPFKAYEFQRYFPYKKDKLYIFVRQDHYKNQQHDQ